VLNRFFGQKPQAEPKRDSEIAQEHVEGDSVSEKSINPLRTA